MIELSENGGASWVDIGDRAAPAYSAALCTGTSNPLAGRGRSAEEDAGREGRECAAHPRQVPDRGLECGGFARKRREVPDARARRRDRARETGGEDPERGRPLRPRSRGEAQYVTVSRPVWGFECLSGALGGPARAFECVRGALGRPVWAFECHAPSRRPSSEGIRVPPRSARPSRLGIRVPTANGRRAPAHAPMQVVLRARNGC